MWCFGLIAQPYFLLWHAQRWTNWLTTVTSFAVLLHFLSCPLPVCLVPTSGQQGQTERAEVVPFSRGSEGLYTQELREGPQTLHRLVSTHTHRHTHWLPVLTSTSTGMKREWMSFNEVKLYFVQVWNHLRACLNVHSVNLLRFNAVLVCTQCLCSVLMYNYYKHWYKHAVQYPWILMENVWQTSLSPPSFPLFSNPVYTMCCVSRLSPCQVLSMQVAGPPLQARSQRSSSRLLDRAPSPLFTQKDSLYLRAWIRR